ncbi:DNA-binding response regulator [hydrothermal vent metagenome]|uniref:DNA-binding response regulator n=1 Tax=hydrothermal vent metagenome TaxID=652676 RepID=A0A1W1CXJ8_9ZZZZ
MSVKILLLEDDKLFNETLQDFLEEEDFMVDYALDPYSALDLTYQHIYDLYLFDVNLPYESGFNLLEKLRTSGDMTPTIFLTSRDDKASLTQGFEIGGDDYMKKPIDLDELLLRIYALLRRQARRQRVPIGAYMLDMVEKTLYLDNTVLEVTQKAIELLVLLVEAKGEVVSSEIIKSRLWAAGQHASDGSLRVYITQLKKYFPESISNVRGIGYKWVEV